MRQIGAWIATVVKDINNDAMIKKVHADVTAMAGKFTLYPE
jgi:glycine/serine hydroxymethyltransferase